MSHALRNASFRMCFQWGLWYGGSSMIIPLRVFAGESFLPKSFDTRNIMMAM